MTDLPAEILSWLGLARGERLVEIRTDEAPGSPVGRGLVAQASSVGSSGDGLPPDLLSAMDGQPRFGDELPYDEHIAPARARPWLEEGRVVLLEGVADKPERTLGTAGPGPGHSWILDGRSGPAAVVLRTAEGPLVMWAGGGRVGLAYVETAADPWTERLRTFTPTKEPALPEVDVLSFVVGATVRPWLSDLARAMAKSPSAVERTAAIGLVGRLAGGEVEEPGKLMEALLAGESGPRARAMAWAREHGPRLADVVLRHAVEEAGLIVEELAVLRERVENALSPADREGADALAQALCLRRDDLECVSFVLSAAGVGEELDELLAEVDREAESEQSIFAVVADQIDDRRLSAVAALEPDAWWAILPTGP
jgi:hypothetical protein